MPAHLSTGYFVAPTVFKNVKNSMTIAQEEIFGPVLCIIPYDTEEEVGHLEPPLPSVQPAEHPMTQR